MNTQNTPDALHVLGHVKWFDPGKGFGFIVADLGGPDILLHSNVLRNFGQSSIADGAFIEVMVQRTGRGLQAIQVLGVTPPVAETASPMRDMVKMDPADIAACAIEPARVKWFDKSKGFGFANVFRSHADVFIHIEVLRRSGLSDLQAGEAVGLRFVDGERGAMAVEIVGWEVAAG